MSDAVQHQGTNFNDAPIVPMHRKIVTGTFMGQISDGYTLGILGISLSYATIPLGLNSYWLGIIAAASLVGILVGSLFAGMIADRLGRKALYSSLMAGTMIVSISQFFISDPAILVVARFILGLFIGADYTIGIALLSEWMPDKPRARSLAWLLVFWAIGYTLAYLVGFFMDGLGDNGWRYVLATSAIPAGIALAIRLGSPESPKWLLAKGRIEEATNLVKKYLGDNVYLEPEAKPESTSWFALFAPNQWRKTVTSCVFFAAQVLPFFAISIFLPLIFGELKIDNPRASGIFYNVFTMIGVLFGTWVFGRIGRRPYLMGTFYGAAAILIVMTVWQTMPSILALVLITAFSMVLAMAIVIEFAYPPELFPTELRGSGVGLTVCFSRVGAAAGAFMLPVVSESWGIYAALWICVASLLVGGIVCQMWAPETSQKFKDKANA